MFLFEVKTTLCLAELQFATAIVLDRLGFSFAGEQILKQYSAELSGLCSNLEYKTAEDLETKLRESNDFVREYLEYLWETSCVYSKAQNQRGGYKAYNLHELCGGNLQLTNLHQSVVKFIARTEPLQYLTAFAQTRYFAHEFEKEVKRIRKGCAKSIVEELYNLFKLHTAKYYATGAYAPESRTPVAYLINAFKQFFVKHPDVRVILNDRSVYATLGSEGNLSLSMLLPTTDEQTIDFNFIDVATKINRASNQLFRHNNGVFSDLVTWYRHFIAESLFRENKTALREIFVGYTVNAESNFPDENGTVIQKSKARYALCEYYFENLPGLTPDGIYGFYRGAVDVSLHAISHRNANGGVNDGLGYFTTANSRIKSVRKNAEKLRIDIEGFHALTQLVEYLSHPHKDIATDIFHIPVEIFRDEKYLCRFTTLEEYINLYDDVKALCDGVGNSEEGSELLSNEDVLARMGEFSGWMDSVLQTNVTSVMKELAPKGDRNQYWRQICDRFLKYDKEFRKIFLEGHPSFLQDKIKANMLQTLSKALTRSMTTPGTAVRCQGVLNSITDLLGYYRMNLLEKELTPDLFVNIKGLRNGGFTPAFDLLERQDMTAATANFLYMKSWECIKLFANNKMSILGREASPKNFTIVFSVINVIEMIMEFNGDALVVQDEFIPPKSNIQEYFTKELLSTRWGACLLKSGTPEEKIIQVGSLLVSVLNPSFKFLFGDSLNKQPIHIQLRTLLKTSHSLQNLYLKLLQAIDSMKDALVDDEFKGPDMLLVFAKMLSEADILFFDWQATPTEVSEELWLGELCTGLRVPINSDDFDTYIDVGADGLLVATKLFLDAFEVYYARFIVPLRGECDSLSELRGPTVSDDSVHMEILDTAVVYIENERQSSDLLNDPVCLFIRKYYKINNLGLVLNKNGTLFRFSNGNYLHKWGIAITVQENKRNIAGILPYYHAELTFQEREELECYVGRVIK